MQEQIKLAMLIPQFMDFKNGCGDVVSYIQNIEYIDLGEAFKAEIEYTKGSFHHPKATASWTVNPAKLPPRRLMQHLGSASKAKHIDIYFDAHKKKRLDITDAQRRGKIQEGKALAFPKAPLHRDSLGCKSSTDIETDMSGLVVWRADSGGIENDAYLPALPFPSG